MGEGRALIVTSERSHPGDLRNHSHKLNPQNKWLKKPHGTRIINRSGSVPDAFWKILDPPSSGGVGVKVSGFSGEGTPRESFESQGRAGTAALGREGATPAGRVCHFRQITGSGGCPACLRGTGSPGGQDLLEIGCGAGERAGGLRALDNRVDSAGDF